MKIANIIYEDDLVNHEKKDFINYYQTSENSIIKIEEIDNSLPTLIVGWKFLKNNYSELNVNILTHKIIENKLYWEFSFEENKSSHVNGIQSFVENAPDFYFFERYKYINLDPIFYNVRDNQELFDIFPKEINGFYKFKNRMLYFLSEKTIYGLDLDMYKFFKFNIEGIINKLSEINNGIKFFDSEGEYYQKYYKIFPDFSHLKIYLVVIMSK